MQKQFFTKDNGVRLPVSDEYLVPLFESHVQGNSVLGVSS